jgi:hypothetical protein
MNTLVKAIVNQDKFTQTENGALTLKTTSSALVDFFSRAGSMRGNQNGILDLMRKAHKENPEIAVRIALWLRDARGGAGERQAFRSILSDMINFDVDSVYVILESGIIEEIGRWDDYIEFVVDERLPLTIRLKVARHIKEAIRRGNGLAAKWMPRKGKEAAILRSMWGMGPKSYRKFLVNATNVVETKMCSNRWEEIEYPHVPSLAMSRYSRAFGRHDPSRFTQYKNDLVKGKAKVNAGALFPHDLIKAIRTGDVEIAEAQWAALPKLFETTKPIMPIIDVSGSMTAPIDSSGLSAMDVAIGLGLYVMERNEGAFKNLGMTFHERPSWICNNERESLSQRYSKIVGAGWGFSTNIQAAFDLILSYAVENSVAQDEMPGTIFIVSDMEFNSATRGRTNFEEIQRKYASKGYEMPKLVFWNVCARGSHSPVSFDQSGVALVSGYSPSIMKTILKCEDINPFQIMMETVMNPRYDLKK